MIGESMVPQMCSVRQHDAEAKTGVQSQAPVGPADERSCRHKGTEARWIIDESAILQMCSVHEHDAEAETGVPPSSIAGSAD